ncbi:MAG: hypothetical protein KDE56_07250 [Anaerolineales bacterium]|nr:hypothetical protein [Anaerolineales bacterium]
MSTDPRPKINPASIKRVTADTKFYIDYSWWEESDLDLKTFLQTRLNIGEDIIPSSDIEEVDLVDPQTGEVRQVDGFQYLIQSYFNQMPPDFATRTSLVDAAFCVLLANANQPMTAREIAKRVQRSPTVILRTLGGPRVYQGIRPVPDED